MINFSSSGMGDVKCENAWQVPNNVAISNNPDNC